MRHLRRTHVGGLLLHHPLLPEMVATILMISPPRDMPALPDLAVTVHYLLLQSDLTVLSQHHWLCHWVLQPLRLSPLTHVRVVITAVLVATPPAQHTHITQTPVLYLLVAILRPGAALKLSALADVMPG
jgi:hypothetical protein